MTAIGCKSMSGMAGYGSTQSMAPTGQNVIRASSKAQPAFRILPSWKSFVSIWRALPTSMRCIAA